MRTPNGLIDIEDFLGLFRQGHVGANERTRIGKFHPQHVDFFCIRELCIRICGCQDTSDIQQLTDGYRMDIRVLSYIEGCQMESKRFRLLPQVCERPR